MHLITGAIISYLFSSKKENKLTPLLQLKWPIITKHYIPGRVRFQIPLMVGLEKPAIELQKQLKKLDGVKSVQTNSVTGSVLILFDESIIKADLLFTAIIRLLGLEKDLENIPEPRIAKEISKFGKSLDHAIYAKSNGMLNLKTVVPLSLGLVGLYKLIMVKSFSMPTAVTLLWWAYNSLILTDNKKND